MTTALDNGPMPVNRTGITHKVEIMSTTGGVHEGYITANRRDDGSLGEIFLTGFGKSGSTLEGWTQFAAILFSVALRHGADFEKLTTKIAHMKFEPYGPTNNPEIPFCNSVPDYIVRWLALRFGTPELHAEIERIAQEI